ncbi:type IV secretory system conjugative DNA transfer family protein [Tautonia marina]|uniref:type IV secretory system conjugative DNA transfer family protein n=1 Tax=Tautonia marina TaxID=2653855 RepID=UPI00137634F0|nr:type IV secretory system conjugative DNA transfer family protein [Tautonia marina]
MNANPAKFLFLTLLVALAFAASPAAGLLLGVALLAARAFLGGRESPTTHGSARLGTLKDAKEGGLCSKHPESIVLGRATWLGEGASAEQLVKLQDFTHLLTVAGTGRGKSVSTVIPNAFLWPKSLIVTDKDFEVFNTVSGYRKRSYGQEQYAIDPMGMLGGEHAGFNPLAEIDGDARTLFEDAWALANLIVFRKGTEPEPYWNDAAEAVIAGFIAFVCACEQDPARRNLLTVRDLLASPANFRTAVGVMKQVTSHHGVIARAAWRMEFLKDKELASVLSSVNRHMNFLGSPGVEQALSVSSFRARDLRSEKGASVYLPIVPGRTEIMGQFNRVVIGSLIRAAAAALPAENNKVLAILDETAQLGRVPALQEATVLFRGRGIRLWMIFQSLNQIHEAYGESAQTLIDNFDTQQYFGLDAATETAQKLSERIGDATVADASDNEGASYSRPIPSVGSESGGSGSFSRNFGVNRNWIARRVLFASEIALLPPKVSLVFHRHLPVLPVELVRWYEDKEFAACRAGAATEEKPARKRAGRRVSLKGMPAAAGHFLLGLGIVAVTGFAAFVHASGGWQPLLRRMVPEMPAPAGPPVVTEAAGIAKPGGEPTAVAEAEAGIEHLRQRIREAELAEENREKLAGLKRLETMLQANLAFLEGKATPEQKKALQEHVRALRSQGVPVTPPEGLFSGELPTAMQPAVMQTESAPSAGLKPGPVPVRQPTPVPDCPDPEACPHSADPVRLHVCFDPAYCPDILRCPHRGGIYYRRR